MSHEPEGNIFNPPEPSPTAQEPEVADHTDTALCQTTRQYPLTRQLCAEIMEKLIIQGDLSGLDTAQRVEYYNFICLRCGVDPATRPFEYIKLNNRLVLYALRSCTEQLRVAHGVSVTDMRHTQADGVYSVTVTVQDGRGRRDMATGAVNVGNAKGDALANLIMKAETKAKRRATLSICGLGMLDETELDTIPAPRPAAKQDPMAPDAPTRAERPRTTAKPVISKSDIAPVWRQFCENVRRANGILPQLELQRRFRDCISALAGRPVHSLTDWTPELLERARHEIEQAGKLLNSLPQPEGDENDG